MNLEAKQLEIMISENTQKQHHNEVSHYERMIFLNEQVEYGKFSLLKPSLTKDGDQWCCLFGENLQEGIVGFGETPHLAILDWNKQWYIN